MITYDALYVFLFLVLFKYIYIIFQLIKYLETIYLVSLQITNKINIICFFVVWNCLSRYLVSKRHQALFSIMLSAVLFLEKSYIEMNGKNAKCFDFSRGKFHGLRGERGNHWKILQEFSRVVADNPSIGFSQIFPKILSICPLP